MSKTFGRWLQDQAGRGDPVGDLGADWKADPCKPDQISSTNRSVEVVRFHILDHSAADYILSALKAAEAEWRKTYA